MRKIRPAKNREFDVVGLGLNAVDYLCRIETYPEAGTKNRIVEFTEQGGGQVATAMVTCARLGLKARYVGKVGNEETGRFSLNSLAGEGVDVSSAIRANCANQFAFILVESVSGERTIFWHRDKELWIDPEELDLSAIESGKVLHLDTHNVEASLAAAKLARARGIPVVLDAETVSPLSEELVSNVDVLIASRDFGEKLTGNSDWRSNLEDFSRMGPSIAVVTLGEKGAAALQSDEFMMAQGYEVDCVDSTGAGDVFHGAFIFGILQDWSLEETLRFSNAAAAMKCRTLGARAGIPRLAEVFEFMSATSEGSE
jgi:sugar/nucleoside kinase (ribokinase family)